MPYKGSFIPYRIFIYPVVQSGMIRITFRLCLFEAPIMSISGCDMVRFRP